MSATYVIREVDGEADVTHVRRLVTAHADARATTAGVEHVYADAARMPGPYVPPQGGIWLAASHDIGIGCVALRPVDQGSAEVKRMFVDPGWRGQGVGRAMLVALISGSRSRGYETLRLGTLDDMTTACRLYESLGFQSIERYRHDEPIDTRFYELAL